MSQAELLPEVAPVSPFQFQEHPIRIQLDGETLWFVAKDVCAALGIVWKSGKGAGNSGSLAAIPAEWQGMRNFLTPSSGTRGGGKQSLKSITEPAVYKLAFRSNKPEADAFTNWIASEVLPSIRKTGKFEATPDASALPASLQSELHALVDAKLSAFPRAIQGRARSEIWARFNRHFKIARYAQLPADRMPEARDYLIEMEVRALASLPASAPLPTPKQNIVPVPCEGKLPTAFFDIRADESTDDKYHAYLEQVEAWRIATITERDRLSHAGMELFEFDRVGRVIFEAGAAFIDDWLNRVALSSISVFDPLLRSCRAPVILARHLNAKFESVSAARKAGLKFV